jgi:hypothetical protein
MARKKVPSASSVSSGPTAALASPTTADLSGKVLSASAPAPPEKGQPRERFWLEVAVVRMSRWLGSLQIAVVLLTLFAFVLAIGTMVESWHSTKIAQELVYRTYWFAGLLALLGVNIFFAAAKKWPWKKHQTGFLITHVGLLTMVTGGILNSLGGTDAQMVLVDNSRPQDQVYGLQVQPQVIDLDKSTIEVLRF